MPVIAVVNRKGGCGKSTFAAHAAAWCARRGHSVMLGDVDRQQSTRSWLRRRDAALPTIAPWALDQKNVLRVPTGITHVVLDTPGGMQGFELARVVMFADAVVIPVCPSIFDRESAAACHAEMMTLPRVASGRCKVAAVGMRVDGRTHHAEMLKLWAEGLNLAFLGVLRETQLYVKALERGLTLFDLPASVNATDLAQWEPILRWLTPVMEPAPAEPAATAARPVARPAPVLSRPATNPASPLPIPLQPAQNTLVQGGRMASVLSGGRPLNPVQRSATVTPLRPAAGPGESMRLPELLKR